MYFKKIFYQNIKICIEHKLVVSVEARLVINLVLISLMQQPAFNSPDLESKRRNI